MSAPLSTRLQNLTRRFLRNRDGNITLMVSASLIPIVAATGMAVDMMRINDARASIQAVADAAVLAAVRSAGTDQQRVAIGNAFVTQNLHGITGVTVEPQIIVKGKDGTANMNVKVQGTLTKVIFSDGDPGAELGKGSSHVSDGVDFVVTSKAHAADGKTTWRCVIALNSTAPDTAYISGSGDFNSTRLKAGSSDAFLPP